MFRSIASVVVSMLVWGGLWVGGNIAMAAVFADSYDENMMTTEPGLLGMAIGLSVVLSILAGFICARIARRREMTHVLILAIIQFLIGVGVQAGVWEQMPLWYHLVFLGLVIPAHLGGGAIAAGRSGADVDTAALKFT